MSGGAVIGNEERYLGCLLGLAAGDAVGTTVEFSPRGSFAPLTDMIGGGAFDLAAGQWTDDTSMALCLAHSLISHRAFDPVDQMNRYCSWVNEGYMSSTGQGFGFGIGSTVDAALRAYEDSGNPFSGSQDPKSAGNGCLMRLAPIPMFFARDREQTLRYAADSARTTHGAPEAVDCTRLFALQIRMALLGADKSEILMGCGYEPTEPAAQRIAACAYADKTEAQIHGSGYVVASLEAALWCFLHTDSYSAAVLKAANLGDDADTTAAICGQLAGAHYGVSAIPQHWRDRLAMRAHLEELATRLLEERI